MYLEASLNEMPELHLPINNLYERLSFNVNLTHQPKCSLLDLSHLGSPMGLCLQAC